MQLSCMYYFNLALFQLIFFFPGFHIHSKKVAEEAIFYSYARCFNGFAAILNEKEAADLASKNTLHIFYFSTILIFNLIGGLGIMPYRILT